VTSGTPSRERRSSPQTSLRRIVARLRRSPLALAGCAWLVLLVVASLFASRLAPYGPLAQNLNVIHAGPSLHHLLGADSLGRDVLSRLMFGGSAVILGAVVTTAVAVGLGLPAGLAAGYRGGRVDAVVAWLADLSFALPAVVILIAVSVISPQNIVLLMVCLGVVASGSVIRLVRNCALGVRDATFVDAARVAGVPRRSIVVRHVLPSAIGPLIVLATQVMAVSVLVLTTLSYLGLGGSPEQPSWGAMIADASQHISIDPWLLVPTGCALILTVLSLTFIGSTARDAVVQVVPSGETRSPTAVARPIMDRAAQATGPTTSLLVIRDLEVTFPRSAGPRAVIDGVNLTVEAGSVLGLVGETGCGKTVTALAVPGLLGGGGRITRGSIQLEGLELASMSDRELDRVRGSRVGFISQEPLAALDPTFTVQSQLSEAIRRHGTAGRSEARRQVLSILADVGIENPGSVARRFPHQLSGGMAQRVAIALALTGRPDLLIADEPTTALDVTVQAGILDLLRDLVTTRGMSLLVVTHDLGVVADICDRVAVMYAGQIVEEGLVEDVLGTPVHPYTMALLGSRVELGVAGARLATIGGSVPSPEEWPNGCRFADRCRYAETICRARPVHLVTQDNHGVRCVRSAELTAVWRTEVLA
jgi:peptide/nickel transport system permease protein